MLKQGSGSIVNVVSGAHMGMPALGIYATTKGAVASMTYSWAMELAGSGVRMNGLSPFGATRMTLPPEYVLDDVAAKMKAEIQKPEANSPVVEFLLSDLSKDVNGQLVRIDKDELHLYTHPALLLPPVVRTKWTVNVIADAFKHELKGRQVPCGVMGMKELPVELQKRGLWSAVPKESVTELVHTTN